MPFLKDRLIEHGWNLIDEDMTTACWFVIQKQANDGSIMTFGFKERGYPNYGDLASGFSRAETSDNTEGVFTAPYNTTTHTLNPHSSNTSNRVYRIEIATTGGYYGDNRMNTTLQYFSTPVQDTEESIAHMYYIIAFSEDGFFIKTRGNPVLAGAKTQGTYFGRLDNITNVPISNLNIGTWGHIQSTGSAWLTRDPGVGSDAGTVHATNYDHLLNYGWKSSYAGYADISYKGAEAYPVVSLFLGSWAKEPLFSVPDDFILLCGKKENFGDENIFIEAKNNTYIFTNPFTNIYDIGFIIKAIESPKNTSLIDTGSGYQITWDTPSDSSIVKIAVYAKTTGYPTAHDDPEAVLIYENNSPSLGTTESYTDTSIERYGQTAYYAVIAFDENTPTPLASLITEESRTKISSSLIELATHPFKLNPSYAAYNYTNKNKINAYYSPIAFYSLNDNAEDNIVLEDLNGLHGTVANANTSDLSVPGKLGNAFDLSGNKYLNFPPSELLKFDNSFTIQAWIKRPLTFLGQDNALFATSDDDSEWRYSYYGDASLSNGFWVRIGGPSAWFTFPYEWTNMDMQFMSFQRWGQEVRMFIDSNRLNVGNPYLSGFASWNRNISALNIGSKTTARYFNGVFDSLEFYKYPLSHLQIKYSYNNGTGRVLTANSVIDGMAVIIAPNSANERAIYTLPEQLNLSNLATINLDCYSKAPGEVFKVVFINEDGSEFSKSCFVTNNNVWENINIDISDIANELKNSITKIAIEALTVPDYNIVSIKNLVRA